MIFNLSFLWESLMERFVTEATDSIVQIARINPKPATGLSSGDEHEDHFIVRDGIQFAGIHLILDL